MHIDQASRDFPNLNFILGHGGVSYVDDSTYLCMYRENIYMDISGFVAVNSPDGWQAHLNRLFRTGINHKIVFGTSWPASRLSISLKKMIDECCAHLPDRKMLLTLNLSQEDECVLEGAPAQVKAQLQFEKAEFMILIYAKN